MNNKISEKIKQTLVSQAHKSDNNIIGYLVNVPELRDKLYPNLLQALVAYSLYSCELEIKKISVTANYTIRHDDGSYILQPTEMGYEIVTLETYKDTTTVINTYINQLNMESYKEHSIDNPPPATDDNGFAFTKLEGGSAVVLADNSVASTTGNNSIAYSSDDRDCGTKGSVAVATGNLSVAGTYTPGCKVITGKDINNPHSYSVTVATGDRSSALGGTVSVVTNDNSYSYATNVGVAMGDSSVATGKLAVSTGVRSVSKANDASISTGVSAISEATGDKAVSVCTGVDGEAVVRGKESIAVSKDRAICLSTGSIALAPMAAGVAGSLLILVGTDEHNNFGAKVVQVDGVDVEEEKLYSYSLGKVHEHKYINED